MKLLLLLVVFVSVADSFGVGWGCYTRYGDVTNLSPTGASAATARQDRLRMTGVSASNALLDNDITALSNKRHCYEQAGRGNCIQPALIAAIASRESRGGALIERYDGYDRDPRRSWPTAYGIMQCDIAHSGLVCTRYPWDSCGHINMMVQELLVPYIRTIQRRQRHWSRDQQLQGGVAAYNFGTSNVQTWGGLDRGTTNDDYSNDIIARAQRLINQYGWN